MMQATIFSIHPLIKQSFFQKLFHQQPEENAVIEVYNLLQKPVMQISADDLDKIDAKYKLHVRREYNLNLQELYAQYLSVQLNKGELTHDVKRDLNRLKALFQIPNDRIDFLHKKLGEQFYRATYEMVVNDGVITEEEKNFLSSIVIDCKLSPSLAESIAKEISQDALIKQIDIMVQDDRLSPGEEMTLKAIADNLGIELSEDLVSKKKLNQLKRYWALENLNLPVVEADINLQKTEVCHMKIKGAELYECKNHYLKSTFINSDKIPFEKYQLKYVDRGTVYVTNKRILFVGIKNSLLPFSKILSIYSYDDGIIIDKETGKNRVIFMTNAREARIIATRLLN
jgi:transcriptional regulator CtsR